MANKLSEEILHFLIDNSDSMISVINSELKYEKVNDSFCRNFRKSREELTGKCPSEIWGKKTFREKIKHNIERSLRGEQVQYRSFFDVSDSDGSFYEVTYKPFKSGDSNLNYAIVETRSLADHDVNSQESRDKEKKYHFLEKNLSFGIFGCTREGFITEANDTFYTILELDKACEVQVRLNDYVSKGSNFLEYISSGEAGETGTFSRLRIITAKGNEIFVRISSYIRPDSKYGNIIEGALEDITREVMLEKRLYQAQRIETLGTLAGGIAHDFNTILTTISGYSEMTMEEAGGESPVHDYMQKQMKAVRKAGDIINQMLLFSEQHEHHNVDLKVEEVLEEAADFIASEKPENISLKKNYGVIDGFVKGDPTQLFRVFLNIMTNALHAMENKEGVMSLCLSISCADNRRYVDIAFGDTGTGINPAVKDRIFEPFFTTKDVKGTGMGLAVSHGIINAMGGEIKVESSEGKGSVFTVRIPLYYEPEGLNMADVCELQNVIIAHDNLHLTRTLLPALERSGYNVSLVSASRDTQSLLEDREQDTDVLFIGDRLINENIQALLRKKCCRDGIKKIVLIRQKDTSGTDSVLSNELIDYEIINEPLTLKDVLNKLN